MTPTPSKYNFYRPNMDPVLAYLTGVEAPGGVAWSQVGCLLGDGYVKTRTVKVSRGVFWLCGTPAEAWETFQTRDLAPAGEHLWLGERGIVTPYPPTPMEAAMWGACGPGLIATATELAVESERQNLRGPYQVLYRTVMHVHAAVGCTPATAYRNAGYTVEYQMVRNRAHRELLSVGMSCSVTTRVPGYTSSTTAPTTATSPAPG